MEGLLQEDREGLPQEDLALTREGELEVVEEILSEVLGEGGVLVRTDCPMLQ